MGNRPAIVIFGDAGPIPVAIPFTHLPVRICTGQACVIGVDGQHFEDLAGLMVALQGKIDAPDRGKQEREDPPKDRRSQQRECWDQDQREGGQDERRHAFCRQRLVGPQSHLLNCVVGWVGPLKWHGLCGALSASQRL